MTGDQADLLVRYMFEITPEEQRRLIGMSAGLRELNRAPSPRRRRWQQPGEPADTAPSACAGKRSLDRLNSNS